MNSPGQTHQGFVFQKDGIDYLNLCLDVTLYFVGSAFEHIDGILDFYTQALEILKKDIVQYETGTMSKPRKIKDDTFSVLPMWLENPRAKQDIMMLRLDNSTTPDSASDRAFQFVAFEPKKAGAVRIVLPSDFMDQSVSPFLELAKSLARKLSFSSGLGGYSLNWNKLGKLAGDAKREISMISQRHPGIDIPDLTGDVRIISEGIKCVNWLTFLNNGYCGLLNGPEEIRRRVNEQVSLHSLNNGIMIQAGPRPEHGDVNRRSIPEAYRSIGGVVANLRAKGHLPFIPSTSEDLKQATEKWLARFDS